MSHRAGGCLVDVLRVQLVTHQEVSPAPCGFGELHNGSHLSVDQSGGGSQAAELLQPSHILPPADRKPTAPRAGSHLARHSLRVTHSLSLDVELLDPEEIFQPSNY